jgi:RNA recognition motif-containing protein
MNFKRIWSTVFLITAIACLASFAEAQTPKAEQMKIYVGNLSFQTSSEDLHELFSQAGEVVSAEVVEDKETGRSRGFGFVVMASREEGEAAIQQFNGKEFGGRNLNVNEARSHEDRGGGGGGRGGFGGGGNRGGSNPINQPKPTVSKVPTEPKASSKAETPKQTETPKKEVETPENDEDADETETVRIYVSNLSPETTEDALREAFEEFGEVKSVKLERDASGKSKGFGYVEMAADEAEEAISELNGSELNGKKIQVKKVE